MSAQRRGGSARVDAARLDRELALRGLSARELAAAAGLHESAISRARHGRVQYATLRAIAIALMTFPILEGTELLVTQPERELEPGEALAVPA